MKKLFTLALALSVAFVGYSQERMNSKNELKKQVSTMHKASRMENPNLNANVESQPNMTRTDSDLDWTVYDWQTNSGPRTWTINWPDGKISFAYTVASDLGLGDRGTGISTYDATTDEWVTSEGRVEQEKTGFGSIARYGENSIIVAAHTATNLGLYLIEDKDEVYAESAERICYLEGTYDPCWPVVMTSGPNRDIIHVVATANGANGTTVSVPGAEGVQTPFIYFRSKDGGQTWDKENVILPYLGPEYGLEWGSNSCYFMETTENNRLTLVINNTWSDGIALYSDDNGDTWERVMFYSHPDIEGMDNDSASFMYPRYTSCAWAGDEFQVLYEFNGGADGPGSGSYYPGIGGIGFWSSTLPYNAVGTTQSAIPGNLTPGQPFVMDSAYLYYDFYATWWGYSDATHDMWPEYVGYLAPMDALHNPIDPYGADTIYNEDFSIPSSAFKNHGANNGGVCSTPSLAVMPGTNGSDLVAVWTAMDSRSVVSGIEYYRMKLFARHSGDYGRTWGKMVNLTNTYMFLNTESTWPQASIVGNKLVIAVQMDGDPDSYTIGTSNANNDTNPNDNYYQGLVFDLDALFPDEGVSVPEVVNNTISMSIYPNPAVDKLNVVLSNNSDIVVYNIMGQQVMTVQGQVGFNTIDINNLTSGVYFVQAGSNTQKFIVK